MSNKDIKDRLYNNLRVFRNEIVHRNNFEISNESLKIEHSQKSIIISKNEMKHFVSIV